MRVGDLGGRGIMATSTTVDAIMILAMLATVLAATTGQTVAAPMLMTPATMTASSRRRCRFWEEFEMRAQPTRESGPHGII
eukprot:626870-Pyramimonas_sp.AAC.1